MASKKTLVLIAVLSVAALSATAYAVWMNGGSLDFSDSELLVILTDSMDGDPQPYDIAGVPAGSLVMVRHDISEIRAGDIIGYRIEGVPDPFFHRAVSVREGSVVLKGDNAAISEEIPLEDLVGRVVGVDTNMGKVVLFLKSGLSMSIIMMALASILILTLLDIVRYRRGDVV